MFETLRKAGQVLRHTGVMRTVQRGLQRAVPPWLFDVNSLLAVDVNFSDCRFAPVSDDWPYRWGGKKDLELLTQSGMSTGEVCEFFEQDAHVALCEMGGKLVAYTWYVPNPVVKFDWIRVVPDGALYGSATYVAPEYRGQGLHYETRKFSYPALADRGYARVISFIESLNRSSLRAGKVSPRRYMGKVSYVRLLGLVIYGMDGKWGAGFWNASRPFEVQFKENLRA